MTYSLPLEVSRPRKFPFSATRSFPGSYESLARIGNFVRKIAQDAGFKNFEIYSIEMAVDEACSNIIEHGYLGEGKGIIHCTCSANETGLTIELKDRGKSFDSGAISQPNLSENIDEREAHGLGLYFIQQWMDEVSFTTDGPENILTMVKHR
jgi:serine/threonine-protein kinase RsbW